MESVPAKSNKINLVEKGKDFIEEIIKDNFQSLLEEKNTSKEIKDEKYFDYFIELSFYDGDKYIILTNKKDPENVMKFEVHNHIRKIKFIFCKKKSIKIEKKHLILNPKEIEDYIYKYKMQNPNYHLNVYI